MQTMVPGFFKKGPDHLADTQRLKAWTRERFRLSEEAASLVSELACGIAGCPPLETVIAFWPEDGQRRHLKIFKPLAEVTPDDLPPWWMKDALIMPDTIDCSCC